MIAGLFMSPHQDLSPRNNPTGPAGFTLIEVLVSLALLTTGLIPAFVLASNAANLSTAIKNSLISANLAQEGVEVVQAIRYGNWFSGDPFDTGLTGCTIGCRVQYDSNALIAGGVATALRLNPTTGLYQYATGPDTIFTRTITITPVSAVELKVVSEVTWRERTVDKKVTIEDHLFDWIK